MKSFQNPREWFALNLTGIRSGSEQPATNTICPQNVSPSSLPWFDLLPCRFLPVPRLPPPSQVVGKGQDHGTIDSYVDKESIEALLCQRESMYVSNICRAVVRKASWNILPLSN